MSELLIWAATILVLGLAVAGIWEKATREERNWKRPPSGGPSVNEAKMQRRCLACRQRQNHQGCGFDRTRSQAQLAACVTS